MPQVNQGVQESRSRRCAIAVTPSEKEAIRAVARAKETDESNLLRAMSIEAILGEYRRLQEALLPAA